MLFVGEKVGTGAGPAIDIALDPLEGTTICASAGPNSLAVLAIAEAGGLLNAPDVYGADRFHMVGHDWGAVIGWWVAAKYPQRLVESC